MVPGTLGHRPRLDRYRDFLRRTPGPPDRAPRPLEDLRLVAVLADDAHHRVEQPGPLLVQRLVPCRRPRRRLLQLRLQELLPRVLRGRVREPLRQALLELVDPEPRLLQCGPPLAQQFDLLLDHSTYFPL